ncbi:unnamed protein product, partial [marine sediment metagenome]
GNEIYKIPTVVALNKYDLDLGKKLDENDFISYIEFEKFRYLSLNKTIAVDGKGVLDSFKQIINFIFPQLTININLTS